MKKYILLLAMLLPLPVSAGVVFEIVGGESVQNTLEPQTITASAEGDSLRIEISAKGTPDPKNSILVRRIDGGVTVVVVDHTSSTIYEGTASHSINFLAAIPSGRVEMGAAGLRMHASLGGKDVWIEAQSTAIVGEVLGWMELFQRITLDLEEGSAFLGGEGFEDDTTFVVTGRPTLVNEVFETPGGYKRQPLRWSFEEETSQETEGGGENAPAGNSTSESLNDSSN